MKLNDGKFEIILIPAVKSIADVPSLLNKLHAKKYDGEDIIFLQADNITLRCKNGAEWLIDGENAGKLNEVKIINNKRAIELFCPKKQKIISRNLDNF